MFTTKITMKSVLGSLGPIAIIITVVSSIFGGGFWCGDIMAEREQIVLQKSVGSLQSTVDQLERTNSRLLERDAVQKSQIDEIEAEVKSRDSLLREADIKLAARARVEEENRTLIRSNDRLLEDNAAMERKIEDLRTQLQLAESEEILLSHIESLTEEKWQLRHMIAADTETLNELSGMSNTLVGNEDGSILPTPRNPRYSELSDAEIEKIRENLRQEIEGYQEQIRSLDQLIAGIYARIGIRYVPEDSDQARDVSAG